MVSQCVLVTEGGWVVSQLVCDVEGGWMVSDITQGDILLRPNHNSEQMCPHLWKDCDRTV